MDENENKENEQATVTANERQADKHNEVSEILDRVRKFRAGVVEHLKDPNEGLYVIDLSTGIQSLTDLDISGTQYLVFSQLKEKVVNRYPEAEDIKANTVAVKFNTANDIRHLEVILAAMRSRMVANAADVTAASSYTLSEPTKAEETPKDAEVINGEQQ